jgi:hypothetical protein
MLRVRRSDVLGGLIHEYELVDAESMVSVPFTQSMFATFTE